MYYRWIEQDFYTVFDRWRIEKYEDLLPELCTTYSVGAHNNGTGTVYDYAVAEQLEWFSGRLKITYPFDLIRMRLMA